MKNIQDLGKPCFNFTDDVSEFGSESTPMLSLSNISVFSFFDNCLTHLRRAWPWKSQILHTNGHFIVSQVMSLTTIYGSDSLSSSIEHKKIHLTVNPRLPLDSWLIVIEWTRDTLRPIWSFHQQTMKKSI